MGITALAQIRPGMVLAEDVRDVNGRLLLSRGKTIGPEHIRVFKIWGVNRVSVLGALEPEAEARPAVDPQRIEAARRELEPRFRRTDRSHPAVAEMFRTAALYRAARDLSFPPEPDLPPAETAAGDRPPRRDFLEAFMEKEIALPEISTIVFELNEVIANPLSTADQMAQVIHKSPSLTALLLKIVNSALYSLPAPVDRVSLAVTLIGTRELSALALGLSVISAFRHIPRRVIDMPRFLEHSLACGIASRLLAAQKNLRQTEQLFSAGLLHDLGRLILYLFFPDDMLAALRTARREGLCLFEAERRELGCPHAWIGQVLLKKWHLPLLLEHAACFHHEPEASPDPLPAAIVHVSDVLVNALGIGSSGERLVPPLRPAAWEALGLPPECLETIASQTAQHLEAMEFLLRETLS
ncbi:MAG: HDOD domain-containing protein [Desulfobacterales bacterium]